MDELEDIYYEIHWLFDQVALLQVRLRKLEQLLGSSTLPRNQP